MANNFKVWIDDETSSSFMNASDFNLDSERVGGFQAGTAAHSVVMNSALRQANLIAASLMELVNNSNLSLKSTISDVSQGIATYLAGLTVSKANNADVTTESANDNVVKFKIGTGTGFEKTINNVSHATSADDYNSNDGTIKNKFDEIDTRLTNLGFRQGTATLENATVPSQYEYINYVKRQGNYVIGEFSVQVPAIGTAMVKMLSLNSVFSPKLTQYDNITFEASLTSASLAATNAYGVTVTIIATGGGVAANHGDIFIQSNDGRSINSSGILHIIIGYEADPIS